MGFERNYQVKIPSNQIKQRRLYFSGNVPAKVYSMEKLDLSKKEIRKDNQRKSGVYMWVNQKSGFRYVGSATDLWNRLSTFYLNENSFKNYKKGNFRICNALLKYKYSAFNLEILEYCEPSNQRSSPLLFLLSYIFLYLYL